MLSSNSFWIKFISPRQHLLINAAPCKVVSLGLHTVSLATMPPSKAFHVYCWTFGKCILQFCLNNGDIIKSPSFESHIKFWEKKVATWRCIMRVGEGVNYLSFCFQPEIRAQTTYEGCLKSI
jgi:hypothetical protein